MAEGAGQLVSIVSHRMKGLSYFCVIIDGEGIRGLLKTEDKVLKCLGVLKLQNFSLFAFYCTVPFLFADKIILIKGAIMV